MMAGMIVVGNHYFSLGHCSIWLKRGPRIRAKMVPAENDPRRVKTGLVRDAVNEVNEADRSHADVASVLVDLVADRFEQDHRVSVAQRMTQCGFHDQWMGEEIEMMPQAISCRWRAINCCRTCMGSFSAGR